MKKLLIFFLCTMISQLSFGQDFHFTQYFMSPQTLNPALVGQFNGCLRVNTSYRNQWASLMGANSFNTKAGSIDGKLLQNTLKGNFIGIGANFFNDVGGDAQFGTQAVGFSVAYCQILNKKNPMTLAAGLQFGSWQRKLTLSNLKLENQFEVLTLSNNSSFSDIGTGLLFYHQPFNWLSYQTGFSLTHLTRPNQTFAHYNDLLGTRFQYHATAFVQFADMFTVIPMVQYSTQKGARELNVSALGKVLIDDNLKYETAIYFGTGLRFTRPGADALAFYFRYDIFNFAIGVSYDVNVSPMHVLTKYQGGPELSLQYMIRCPKTKQTVYSRGKKMFCPKF